MLISMELPDLAGVAAGLLVALGTLLMAGSGADATAAPGPAPRLTGWERFLVWVAEGFGSGRAPFAPGTFGSVVGLGWFVLLVATGRLTWFVAGTVAAVVIAVPLCGAAERLLRRHDPGSVVFDEIAAVPVCFLPWVISAWRELGAMPSVAHFFHGRAWLLTLGIFVAFRVLDALKPWPISRVQGLPGGWGVTADDVVAAAAVAVLSLLVIG